MWNQFQFDAVDPEDVDYLLGKFDISSNILFNLVQNFYILHPSI